MMQRQTQPSTRCLEWVFKCFLSSVVFFYLGLAVGWNWNEACDCKNDNSGNLRSAGMTADLKTIVKFVEEHNNNDNNNDNNAELYDMKKKLEEQNDELKKMKDKAEENVKQHLSDSSSSNKGISEETDRALAAELKTMEKLKSLHEMVEKLSGKSTEENEMKDRQLKSLQKTVEKLSGERAEENEMNDNQLKSLHEMVEKLSEKRTEENNNDHQPPLEQNDREQCVVSPIMKSNSNNHKTSEREDNSASSCAILFFGLPRSFKTFVLPSIIENVIVPNMDNNCDYYLHYHAVTSEEQNRMGEEGGRIYGNDVFLLKDAIRETYERESAGNTGNSIPHISITNSTIEEFEKARSQAMDLYETTLDKNGEYLYFPYKAVSWKYPNTMRNMVKQWDSIDAVWQHMEENARHLKRNYSRVAMLRNDVMYVTPFDVYQLSTHKRDVENNHIVIPDWANYPVNDRMIAGPYKAVKIWATERFWLIERHVRNYPIPGWGVHSETFLNFTIIPAMLNASRHSASSGYAMDQDPNICFLRARTDGSVWIADCYESFDCDMEPVVLQLLAKHSNIANSSNVNGLNCTRKSIGGIKNQDVLSCREDTTFSVL